MKGIGQPVDDGNACPERKLFGVFLFKPAEFDRVEHPAEHARRVFNRFFCTELDILRRHKNRVTAFFAECAFKSASRARRSFFENKCDSFSGKARVNFSPFRFRFYGTCDVEQRFDFVR